MGVDVCTTARKQAAANLSTLRAVMDKRKSPMADVIHPSFPTTLELSPERILEGAKEKLTEVVVLGWEKDGSFYFAASDADMSRSAMLLLRALKDIQDRMS